ncbi:hypothetical protein JHK87_043500 [Glycine soja]|nr:hypothetical protein JHK87_043500 [Glycine soja]
MAAPGSDGGGGGTAKATVAKQISQVVQSTSNLLQLMQHSSLAQAQLVKLPKNLLTKVPTIKNTEQVLEKLPGVISSLDAHMENGLQKSEPSLCSTSKDWFRYFQIWKVPSLSRNPDPILSRRNLNQEANLKGPVKETCVA